MLLASPLLLIALRFREFPLDFLAFSVGLGGGVFCRVSRSPCDEEDDHEDRDCDGGDDHYRKHRSSLCLSRVPCGYRDSWSLGLVATRSGVHDGLGEHRSRGSGNDSKCVLIGVRVDAIT
jgi:hypothetical protein